MSCDSPPTAPLPHRRRHQGLRQTSAIAHSIALSIDCQIQAAGRRRRSPAAGEGDRQTARSSEEKWPHQSRSEQGCQCGYTHADWQSRCHCCRSTLPVVLWFTCCSPRPAVPRKPRKAAQQSDSTGSSALGLLAVAAAAALGFWWWRKRQAGDGGDGGKAAGGRSAFKFPGGSQAAVQGPKGRQGNNKKNKARRREEKARRAEKREK